MLDNTLCIIEHFGNADAVPQPPERCLSRKAGIMRCCPNCKVPSPKGEGGRGPARGRMRGQVTVISRKRVAMASSALISRLAATASPRWGSLPGRCRHRPSHVGADSISAREGLRLPHTTMGGQHPPPTKNPAVWYRQRAFFISYLLYSFFRCWCAAILIYTGRGRKRPSVIPAATMGFGTMTVLRRAMPSSA